MNLKQLKQFLAVSKSGNISRSAKDQNISQPALTRSLKNLESEIGVDLIARRSNGVFLTEYGEHLLEYAQCTVSDMERVRREITAMKEGRQGQISIGVGPSFSISALPRALSTFLSLGREIEVKIVEGFAEDLCTQLRNGTLDVVLSLFPSSFDLSDFEFSKL